MDPNNPYGPPPDQQPNPYAPPLAMGPAPDYVSNEDLSDGAIVAIYISGILCACPMIITTSVLYYMWKDKHPLKAATLNRHAWRAFGIGFAIGLLLRTLGNMR